ncbi:Ventral Anterior Homeobox 1 [Manis pentadactyla]|nr:Ventral Anterior Homeobox 1 [Manis pentadactyla]
MLRKGSARARAPARGDIRNWILRDIIMLTEPDSSWTMWTSQGTWQCENHGARCCLPCDRVLERDSSSAPVCLQGCHICLRELRRHHHPWSGQRKGEQSIPSGSGRDIRNRPADPAPYVSVTRLLESLADEVLKALIFEENSLAPEITFHRLMLPLNQRCCHADLF